MARNEKWILFVLRRIDTARLPSWFWSELPHGLGAGAGSEKLGVVALAGAKASLRPPTLPVVSQSVPDFAVQKTIK